MADNAGSGKGKKSGRRALCIIGIAVVILLGIAAIIYLGGSKSGPDADADISDDGNQGPSSTAPAENPREDPGTAPADEPPADEPPADEPPSIELDSEEYRDMMRQKGEQAILDILPDKYSMDIPLEELEVSAVLEDRKLMLRLLWQTDTAPQDVVSLLGERMEYALAWVEEENEWRSPEGAAAATRIKINDDFRGMEIRYYFDIVEAGEDAALLTNGFPLGYFEHLPEDLVSSEATRSLDYIGEMDIWAYRLEWEFETTEGERIYNSLPSLYEGSDGYRADEKDEHRGLSFNINEKDIFSFGFRLDGNKSKITAVYEYQMPLHSHSSLVKELTGDPEGILLSGMPEAYKELFGGSIQGIKLSYSPEDGYLSHEIQIPDQGNIEQIVETVGQATSGGYSLQEHGGYTYKAEGIESTIKANGENITVEFSAETAPDFTSPYIQDIYPMAYQPELPEALSDAPYLMTTGYGKDPARIEFSKTWRLDETQAGQAWEEINGKISGYHQYREDTAADRAIAACIIKDYDFFNSIEKKGDRWLLTISFRYFLK